MKTGRDLIIKARTKIGCKYQLGIITPKDDANACIFDCAEFASWDVYQVTGKLYGCANNNGNPHSVDAYSGFWARDADEIGVKCTIEEAAKTEGALVLRLAGHGMIGHIVFSVGDGSTVEAHSTKDGVIASKLSGRRWDFGIKLPFVDYSTGSDVVITPPVGKIYRITQPIMYDPFIKKIQKALGFSGSDVDGKYGIKTFTSVRAFQIKKGLVADGECGAKTIKALGLI